MTAEPTFTLEGRPTVRVERVFAHPIERVWQAVTSPEHLGRWFPSPVEIELRPGGAMRFGAFEGDAATGTVEEVEEPHRLAFTWGTDRLTFELARSGDDTRFTLVHSFDDRCGAPSFATGWEMCLAGLRSVLADQPLPAPDRGIARHEELVTAFGLDQPEISEAGDGWTVRVERQLTCPAEVAWDLWFGTDPHTGEQRRAPEVGMPLTPYLAPDHVVGTMTEVDQPRVMAWDVAPGAGPGAHVRVELTAGTGHGARVILTATGSDPAERDEAAAVWGNGAIGHLAAQAATWAQDQAVGAEGRVG